MSMKKEKLFDRCLEAWGLDSQLLMLVEECSELIQAALHLRRKLKQEKALQQFIEEIVDVEFMIEEMKHYFNYPFLYNEKRNFKETRLLARLINDKK